MLRRRHRWLGWGLCSLVVLTGGASGVFADRTPPPRPSIVVQPSEGCPQSALAQAVKVTQPALESCLYEDGALGKTTLRCTFDDAGKVKDCSHSSVEGSFAKDTLACLSKAVRKLTLRKEAWAGCQPSQCVAKIDVALQRGPHHRRPQNNDFWMID
jgi:hypothetical protein